MENDLLEGAQAMDTRYHQAKLFGLMMTNEGAEYAWREHQEIRAALLTGYQPRPEMTRDEWLARVATIDRKMQRAGLVPPHSGVLN